MIPEESLRRLAHSVVNRTTSNGFKIIEVLPAIEESPEEIFRQLQYYRTQYEEQCKENSQKENLAMFHTRDNKLWVKRSLCGLVCFLDRRVLFYDPGIKPEDHDIIHCPQCKKLRIENN